jgi:hypothetical protein
MEGCGNAVTRQPARRELAIGDYEVVTVAGAGGIGIATPRRALGRVSALKVIREEVGRASGVPQPGRDPDGRRRALPTLLASGNDCLHLGSVATRGWRADAVNDKCG